MCQRPAVGDQTVKGLRFEEASIIEVCVCLVCGSHRDYRREAQGAVLCERADPGHGLYGDWKEELTGARGKFVTGR